MFVGVHECVQHPPVAAQVVSSARALRERERERVEHCEYLEQREELLTFGQETGATNLQPRRPQRENRGQMGKPLDLTTAHTHNWTQSRASGSAVVGHSRLRLVPLSCGLVSLDFSLVRDTNCH